MYRVGAVGVEVLLVHPGGPFWARKDKGFWSIPKGEPGVGEEMEAAARREFGEETGFAVTEPLVPLGSVKQAGGKVVWAWGFLGNGDAALVKSNLFEMEWPPRSGRREWFPEVDRAGWFEVSVAKEYLLGAQGEFLDRLVAVLG